MATVIDRSLVLPGPMPLPVAGPKLHFARFLINPIDYMTAQYRDHGDLSVLTRGSTQQVFAFGPHYNHQLLSNPDTFQSVLDMLTPKRLKAKRHVRGLLNMNGEQHRQQRRLMLPAFHKKQVERYHDEMVGFTQQVIDRWLPGTAINAAFEMQQITLRVAAKTLFGLDITSESHSLGRVLKRFISEALFAPGVMLFPFNIPGTPFWRAVRIAAEMDAAVLDLIQRKRTNLAEQHDVLSMLMQAHDEDGSTMTDGELLGQAITLLVAGHETSANALTWTLFLLAQHPAIYADVVDEIDGLLHGAPPTLEQVQKLPLLEAVIKESMRLLPPAALASRVAAELVEMGGYHLPKGSVITMSQYITHRMPEIYSDPQRFAPARWEQINPSVYEYLTFGGGPRMCIGATFAMLEIKIVLAMVLQRFRLQLPPNTVINAEVKVTLSPDNGIPLLVERQDRQFSKVPVTGNIRHMIDL